METPARRQPHGKRLGRQPEHIEVVERIIDVAETERIGVDGQPLVRITDAITERIDYIPSHYRRLRIVRPVYGRPFTDGDVQPRAGFLRSLIITSLRRRRGFQKRCEVHPTMRRHAHMLNQGDFRDLNSMKLALFPGFRFILRPNGSVCIFQELPDRFKWDSAPDLAGAVCRARKMEDVLNVTLRECEKEGTGAIWGTKHYKRYLDLLDEGAV